MVGLLLHEGTGIELGRPRVVADPRCLRAIPIPALGPLGWGARDGYKREESIHIRPAIADISSHMIAPRKFPLSEPLTFINILFVWV